MIPEFRRLSVGRLSAQALPQWIQYWIAAQQSHKQLELRGHKNTGELQAHRGIAHRVTKVSVK